MAVHASRQTARAIRCFECGKTSIELDRLSETAESAPLCRIRTMTTRYPLKAEDWLRGPSMRGGDA